MVICIFLFAAPLTVVAQVFKDKSSELLPPAQCLMQFLNCGDWLIVGLNTSAMPVIVCNLLGFLLSVVQLVLIFMYPHRKVDARDLGRSHHAGRPKSSPLELAPPQTRPAMLE